MIWCFSFEPQLRNFKSSYTCEKYLYNIVVLSREEEGETTYVGLGLKFKEKS